MTKEHKLYELSKELVYQMTGKYTEDVQDADFQIAWTYLSKAMNFTPCCTEFVCDHPEDKRTYRRSGKDSYCNKCEKMVKAN